MIKYRLLIPGTAIIAGCTLMVDPPVTFTGRQRIAGIDYATAVDYVNSADQTMRERLKGLDRFDSITKSGLGLGVGGAGISAVFRGSLDLILGFVTFGATNYATSQLIDPKSLGDVFNAGILNLNCIQAAGSAAFEATRAIRPSLPSLRTKLVSAIQKLQQDKTQAGSAPKYATDVATADAAIDPANNAVSTIDKYYTATNVGEVMVQAVDSTIIAVNQQVRTKSPNIDAIAQSGSIFNNFIAANTNLRTQTQAAIKQASQGFVAQGALDVSRDSLQQQFDADEALLKVVIASIPQLDSSAITNIAACKTQFAAEAPVTVVPSGPISITAGGAAVTLNVTGKAPVRVQWDGENPPGSDVLVNTNLSQISLTATATAKAGAYTFEAIDFAGKTSGAIQLNLKVVTAPPPAVHDPAKPHPPAATKRPAHVSGVARPSAVPNPATVKKSAAAAAAARPLGPPPPPADH